MATLLDRPRRSVAGRAGRTTIWPALLLVGAVGLALRLALVGFGLPDLHHPDEPSNINTGVLMASTGTSHPDHYGYPSFVFDLVAVVVRLRDAVGVPVDVGTVAAWQGFGIAHTTSPGLVVGLRLLTALASVATALVVAAGVAAVGRRRCPDLRAARPALAAGGVGLLLAVSPLTVENGVYITPDAWTGLFCAAALVAALAVLARGTLASFLACGAAVGLAAGTKYNAALVGIALVVASLLGPRGRRTGAHLAAGLAAAVVLFVVTTPGVLVEPAKVLAGIRFEVGHYRAGHPGYSGDAIGAYAAALGRSLGLVALLALAAVLLAVRGRLRREVAVVGSFALAYALLLAVQTVHFDRNLLPLVPALGLLAGFAALAAPARPPRLVPVLAGVGLLAAVVGAVASLRLADDLDQPARVEARAWLEAHVAPDQTLVRESYGPWLDPARFPRLIYWKDATAGPPPPDAVAVVLTEQTAGRYLADPARYPRQAAAYRQLLATWCPGPRFDRGPYVQVLVPCR